MSRSVFMSTLYGLRRNCIGSTKITLHHSMQQCTRLAAKSLQQRSISLQSLTTRPIGFRNPATLTRKPLLIQTIVGMRHFTLSGPRSSDKKEEDTEQVSAPVKDILKKGSSVHENIYTIPNILTFFRLASSPVIGYWVLQGQYKEALMLFTAASITDGLDGWIARRFNMQSIIGTIIDPMADKTLMTILTVTLTMQDLIPVPIAGVILGRDVGLILASFYYRYISLPEPKTFTRYWDFSIPSAEVRPTMISKVNTVIQMAYIGLALCSPVFDFAGHVGMDYLGYTCAATTIWSGASYVYTKDAVKILFPKK